MITPLPDALVDRCVDTLVELHEARGGQWTTGLGLSDLSWHTLRVRRAKPGNGPYDTTRARGDHDPRDDARLHARLWQHLRTRATFTAPARRFAPTPGPSRAARRLPTSGARCEPQSTQGTELNHFARSAERLTAYTGALWKVLHPDARWRWAAAQPVFDPVARAMDFTAQQAAQEEQRQVHRAVAAAAARVHQAYRH
ncbi:hypothetical protein ACFRCW_42630 [Streptomyces sp. NPDC056653]|uniref:hypothetical protein n=1 Tax=Streptomyces sp. NPDC056653 TaxID=3345894 RepID=UPI00367F94CE